MLFLFHSLPPSAAAPMLSALYGKSTKCGLSFLYFTHGRNVFKKAVCFLVLNHKVFMSRWMLLCTIAMYYLRIYKWDSQMVVKRFESQSLKCQILLPDFPKSINWDELGFSPFYEYNFRPELRSRKSLKFDFSTIGKKKENKGWYIP